MSAIVRRVFVFGTAVAVLIVCVAGAAAAPPDRDVVVVNTPAQPVPVVGTIIGSVTAAITPTKEAFQQDVSLLVDAGVLSNTVSFPVPAGKRLVLEYASGNTRVDDKELVRVSILTTAGGVSATHTLAPNVFHRNFEAPITADFIVTYGQTVRIYADPGTQVSVTASRSENAEITATFFQLALSGYMVSCGTTPGCPIQ